MRFVFVFLFSIWNSFSCVCFYMCLSICLCIECIGGLVRLFEFSDSRLSIFVCFVLLNFSFTERGKSKLFTNRHYCLEFPALQLWGGSIVDVVAYVEIYEIHSNEILWMPVFIRTLAYWYLFQLTIDIRNSSASTSRKSRFFI